MSLGNPEGARLSGRSSARIFAVAPMIDWTDRHCRFFHRQLTKRALLFTEMVVDQAIQHGDRDRLLGFHPAEHPVALQLGGSDPARLAEAARVGETYGYDEINLNVGCPSDRVQSGTFGACLMKTPDVVGACVAAMCEAVNVPVTVKCRIGVDDQDPGPALDELADAVVSGGASGIWVHARKAWLKGLSPKENREIPPLDYERVLSLKRRLPNVFIGLNGGLSSVSAGLPFLRELDGIMLGRAAYHDPFDLSNVDAAVYGEAAEPVDAERLLSTMADYADRHITSGGRLMQVTRHMTGLFTGKPGARRWRQLLTEGSIPRDAPGRVILDAYAAIQPGLAAA